MAEFFATVKGMLLFLAFLAIVFKWIKKKLEKNETNEWCVKMHFDYLKEIKKLNKELKEIENKEKRMKEKLYIRKMVEKLNKEIVQLQKNYRKNALEHKEKVEQKISELTNVIRKFKNGEMADIMAQQEAIERFAYILEEVKKKKDTTM